MEKKHTEQGDFFEMLVPKENVKFFGKLQTVIDTGEGTVIVPTENVTQEKDESLRLRLPRLDDEGEVYRVQYQPNETGYKHDEYVTSEQIAEMFECKPISGMVEFNISESLLWREPFQSAQMAEPAQNIVVSDFWRFTRPVSQLHIEDGRVMFNMAAFCADGKENHVTLHRSYRNPDNSYGEEKKTVTVNQLKEMYHAQQRKYAQVHAAEEGYFVMDVKKVQVSDLQKNAEGKPYHFIHLGDNCSFIRTPTQLHEVKGNEDYYRLFFPLAREDGSVTQVPVSKSVLVSEGGEKKWNRETVTVSLEELDILNQAYNAPKKRPVLADKNNTKGKSPKETPVKEQKENTVKRPEKQNYAQKKGRPKVKGRH